MSNVPTIDSYVDALMATRPPLTDAQRERLRSLLAFPPRRAAA